MTCYTQRRAVKTNRVAVNYSEATNSERASNESLLRGVPANLCEFHISLSH